MSPHDAAPGHSSWTSAYQEHLRGRISTYSHLAKTPTRAGRRARTTLARSTPIAATIDDRGHVRANLFQSFLELYLPVGENGAVPGRRPLISWLMVVPHLLQQSDLLSLIITSLSMARLSREKGDGQIALEAKGLFGNALRKLQAALNDRTLAYRDETLAACQACTIYEVHHIHVALC